MRRRGLERLSGGTTQTGRIPPSFCKWLNAQTLFRNHHDVRCNAQGSLHIAHPNTKNKLTRHAGSAYSRFEGLETGVTRCHSPRVQTDHFSRNTTAVFEFTAICTGTIQTHIMPGCGVACRCGHHATKAQCFSRRRVLLYGRSHESQVHYRAPRGEFYTHRKLSLSPTHFAISRPPRGTGRNSFGSLWCTVLAHCPPLWPGVLRTHNQTPLLDPSPDAWQLSRSRMASRGHKALWKH